MYSMCVSVSMCAHEYSRSQRPEASDPLVRKLQVFVSCLTWVLGIELRSLLKEKRAILVPSLVLFFFF